MSYAQYGGSGRNPGVEARIVGNLQLEYTSFEDSVTPGTTERPLLMENMLRQKMVSIDVMEGYNPIISESVNQHSIYHLYEYESQTQFLDKIPRPLIGDTEFRTRFLCCRYVICSIDDWMTRRKPAELLAIRKNGDIYIGANKSLEEISSGTNEAAYGGLNFGTKVTHRATPFEPRKHHSVVKQWYLENRKTHRSMSIFISSVARAFDSRGEVVELKTVGSKVQGKIQNLPGPKARNWWLRALLSGATRIVYGLRMDDMIVNEILEAHIDEFTHGHFKFSATRLFTEVYKIFEKIDKKLSNEGDMCLISLQRYEVDITFANEDDLNKSPFW
ncbi:unnamed protein product [Caenorhabditis nigoni]